MCSSQCRMCVCVCARASVCVTPLELRWLPPHLGGFPFWCHPWVGSLWFRDNIFIATVFLDDPETRMVEELCNILEACWGLAVVVGIKHPIPPSKWG